MSMGPANPERLLLALDENLDHPPSTESPGLVPTSDRGSGFDEDDAGKRRARHGGGRSRVAMTEDVGDVFGRGPLPQQPQGEGVP